jgi:hypothetical protein
MAYVTPPTFVAGDPLAADDLNILGDDIEYLKDIADGVTAAGAQVTRSANQSIASSSDTNISWDTENFDYGGWYSSGTKIIVPAGAIPGGFTSIMVHVTGFAKFGTDGTGKRQVQLLKNGTAFGGLKLRAIDDDTTVIYVDDYAIVEASDYIQMLVWQNSGSSLNVTQARLSVVRHAPAA